MVIFLIEDKCLLCVRNLNHNMVYHKLMEYFLISHHTWSHVKFIFDSNVRILGGNTYVWVKICVQKENNIVKYLLHIIFILMMLYQTHILIFIYWLVNICTRLSVFQSNLLSFCKWQSNFLLGKGSKAIYNKKLMVEKLTIRCKIEFRKKFSIHIR